MIFQKANRGRVILNPPASDAERRWWRAKRRSILGRGLLKMVALLGLGGVGFWVGAAGRTPHWWLHAGQHLLVPIGYAASIVITAVTDIQLAFDAPMGILLKRASADHDLRKQQFLDALDEPVE